MCHERRTRVGGGRCVANEFIDCPHRRGARAHRGEFRGRDDRARFGIVDDVPDLALTIQDVDRDDDDAELQAREPEIDDLDPVGEQQRESVARLEPSRDERVRDGVAAAVEIAERVPIATTPSGVAHSSAARSARSTSERSSSCVSAMRLPGAL